MLTDVPKNSVALSNMALDTVNPSYNAYIPKVLHGLIQLQNLSWLTTLR